MTMMGSISRSGFHGARRGVRSFFWSKADQTPTLPQKSYEIVLPQSVSPQITVEQFPYPVQLPVYAITGEPGTNPDVPEIHSEASIQGISEACRLARSILNEVGGQVVPGMTTEHIDGLVFDLCMASKVYPSPLNYKKFPKSVCTSVNNVACHGIPDDRALLEGDIVNVDITVFKNGYHGDCSETYAVGQIDRKAQGLLDFTRKCLEDVIRDIRPGQPISQIGQHIGQSAQSSPFRIIPAFIGHGIGAYFHGPPEIYHVPNNYPGTLEPGMIFTIEPIVSEGGHQIYLLDDNWTAISADHSRSAQFEHTVLVTESKLEILT